MAGIITLGLSLATVRLFIDPVYTKEDWRSVAAVVRAEELPTGVMDAESLLGLTPYGSSNVQLEFARTEDELSERLAEGKFVLILRSPHESAHALAEAGPFDPLTEAPKIVRDWLAAHPSVPVKAQNYSGVSWLIIGR